MLPHLIDRPLNLQRFPNGAGAPGFWQKDIPETAPHVAHALARDRGRRPHRPGRQRPPDRGRCRVAALARQPGELRDPCLDRQAARAVAADVRLHRHRPGREDDLGRDADAGAALPDRARASRRARLPEDDRQARHPDLDPDRPGQVRLQPDTSDWVERVSRAVGSTVPDLISWEWAKAARKGRARLDYTQNASIKTLVAPYSVRPAAGRAGVDADHVGRAGRPGPATGPLDDPRPAGAGRARSATCSRPRRPTPRSCRRSDAQGGSDDDMDGGRAGSHR